MTRIGFLGVGHLAAALVEGFVRAGHPPSGLRLAPRGQARLLGERHGIAVAADNGELVRDCDLVILATRPADAVSAVAGLPWRGSQVLVSACAGVSLASLEAPAAPARLCRIMPLTASAFGASPTTLFPALPLAAQVLARLGPVLPLASEEAFEAATVTAAVYGWAQALIARTASWQTAQGLDAATARQLCALTFIAAGTMIARSQTPMDVLLSELATPGGITERGLGVLSDGGTPAAWDAACATVLAKLRGSA